MLIPAAAWQRQVSAEMGLAGPDHAGLPAHAGRRRARRRSVRRARPGCSSMPSNSLRRVFIRRWHLHHEVALFIGTAIVVVLVVTLVNGVLYRGFLAGASRVFQPQNTTTRDGVAQPTRPEKSGSPTSFAPWDTLGFQGRNFVATGPHVADLTELNGRPAKEPIRVYAGLQTADTDQDRVDVIMRELERTGRVRPQAARHRPHHRHGWINPVAARSIETMYNGDTALVGLQYSYLPSWISFLGDREKSVAGGPTPHRRHPRALVASSHPTGGPSWCSTARVSAPWPARAPSLAARHREDGLLRGALGGPAPRELAVERVGAATRPRHARGGPALRRRPHRAVLAGHRRRRHRRGRRARMGRHPGAVPAARVRPDRLVVTGSAVLPAGLARRTAGCRPDDVDALVSDRQLLAGRRRHDQRVRRSRRARPQLRRLGARRLGRRRSRPTAGPTPTPVGCAPQCRVRGTNTSVAQRDSSHCPGGGADRMERAGGAAAARPLAGAQPGGPRRRARPIGRGAARAAAARALARRAGGSRDRRRGVCRRWIVHGAATGPARDVGAGAAATRSGLAPDPHSDRHGLVGGGRVPRRAGNRCGAGIRAPRGPDAAGERLRTVTRRRCQGSRRVGRRDGAGRPGWPVGCSAGCTTARAASPLRCWRISRSTRQARWPRWSSRLRRHGCPPRAGEAPCRCRRSRSR